MRFSFNFDFTIERTRHNDQQPVDEMPMIDTKFGQAELANNENRDLHPEVFAMGFQPNHKRGVC